LIRAKPNKIALWIMRSYIYRQMKRCFSHFYLANGFPDVPEEMGLLITPNHSSWWDGFFIDYVCRKYLDRQIHVMMLEEQLQKRRYFSRMGVYSIEPETRCDFTEALEYTLQLIRDPAKFVVMYPQGVLEPYDKRPLVLKKLGLQFLVDRSEAGFLVLPAAFKITYYNKKRPEIAARFGDLLPSKELARDFAIFEQVFLANLEKLDDFTQSRGYGENTF